MNKEIDLLKQETEELCRQSREMRSKSVSSVKSLEKHVSMLESSQKALKQSIDKLKAAINEQGL